MTAQCSAVQRSAADWSAVQRSAADWRAMTSQAHESRQGRAGGAEGLTFLAGAAGAAGFYHEADDCIRAVPNVRVGIHSSSIHPSTTTQTGNPSSPPAPARQAHLHHPDINGRMQPERQTGDVDLERADRDLDVDAAAQGPGSQPTPTHHAPPVPPTNGIARSGAPEDPALGIDVLHQGEDGDADSLPISIERKEGIAPRRGDRLTDCFPQALLRRVLHFTPSWFSVK